MKPLRRKKKPKSKIRVVRVPSGVAADDLIKALHKGKFFARLNKDRTQIITNAPLPR